MIVRIIRGPILNPSDTPDRVDYWPDGAIAVDERNTIVDVGPWERIKGTSTLPAADGASTTSAPRAEKVDVPFVICPPFLDAHIHIPQHPIRGHFTDGVDDTDPNGRLLAGLNRNVFPAEAKFASGDYARQVIRHFAEDTLAHGVVGGAAYATVHAGAAENAMDMLGEFWSVGLVLMNQNCPEYLRVSEHVLSQIAHLSARFGRRHILTDRFAVTVDSTLRRLAVAEAERFGLRTQTHLNEQRAEKRFVEQTLYPDAGSYTNVYLRDGLLDRDAILAHCIHMTDAELDTLAEKRSSIAHCPTSNTLLGSGVMGLDCVLERGIPFALCTDVGASPTTSLLVEMSQFLKVHAGRSSSATPSAALWRSTLGPAKILHLEHQLGRFAPGMPLSYIEIDPGDADLGRDADTVIATALLAGRVTPPEPAAVDRLERDGLGTGLELSLLTGDIGDTTAALDAKVRSVTLADRRVYERTKKR